MGVPAGADVDADIVADIVADMDDADVDAMAVSQFCIVYYAVI